MFRDGFVWGRFGVDDIVCVDSVGTFNCLFNLDYEGNGRGSMGKCVGRG